MSSSVQPNSRNITPDGIDLVAVIEQQVAQSIGHWDGQLSEDRAREFQYYYGMPFGNEVEGESQVVSTDVADTVEGILPSILRIFTSSDDAVRFDPNGPEDEEQAKQQTEVANYIFYRQNNGFLVLYEWFKDALIQKNGIVKYWWEEKEDRSKEDYQGLTDGEFQMLLAGDGLATIELISDKTYPDEAGIQERQKIVQVLQQRMQQAMQEAQQNPQAGAMVQQIQQQMTQLAMQPEPMLHDASVRIIKDASKLCIQCIPPEEFGISAKHPCVSIQETPFCYHRGRQSISSLREAGCPEDILENLMSADSIDYSPEALARDRYIDQQFPQVINPPDPSMREVWVTECFIRMDVDGDGKAELRHIIMPGREVWINEETDHINFAAITPIIMPHRWVGRSVSELVMDIQYTKSTLWRQMLNNLYLTNNPQKAVLSTSGGIVQANLDDLLSSRPGGILREYVPNAIRNIETPFVAGAAFPMLEYMDATKENRTGNTRYNQGTDADSLNKTARGISMIQSAGQQRLDLIARIFAETGVKDLMKGIVYMMSKYNTKPLTLKLRNKWVNVDPREWKTMLNLTINVGLGTGNKDVQLAHLTMMAQKQNELMATGRGYMVSDENIFNLYTKTTEAMGFKHPELFITDPSSVPPEAKKPPPNPQMAKVMADSQIDAAKLQAAKEKDVLNSQTETAIAQMQTQVQWMIAQLEAATRKEIETMKINADGQLAVFDKNHSLDRDAAALTTQLSDKEKDLKVRELGLQYKEALISLQSQIEAMAEAHQKQISDHVIGRSEDHGKAIVDGVKKSMGNVASTLENLVRVTAQQGQEISSVKEVGKIQTIKIDDVQMDQDGKIIGAKITKTVQ